MAADVVGYSRLMEADATGTVATLRRLRSELFAPAVSGHRGRVVKSMGDGWIVTFASASDAVTCAMRLQDKMVLEPDIQIRVGVHVGDISVLDEDVFGEGVNIAARLEALTEPGGVSISDAVHAMIDGTLRPAFDDAGAQGLKNIERPVRVWTRGGLAGAREQVRRARTAVILPLQIVPVTCTPQTEDLTSLGNALTNDLDTYLSSSRWLSTQVRAQPDTDVHVLQPVLRASGSRLRLETRLTARDGSVIWSGKHDGSLEDAFDWQDATGSDIADRAHAAILDHERARILAMPEDDRAWSDWTLLAVGAANHTELASLKVTAGYLQRAMACDPDDTTPEQIFLAVTATASTLGFSKLMAEIGPLIPKAVARIEAHEPAAARRVTMAYPNYVRTGDVAQAHADVAAFMRDMPFDPDALVSAGWVYLFTGHADRALEAFQRFRSFVRFHPLSTGAEGGTGASLMLLGRYEEALTHLDATLLAAPGYSAALRWQAACLAHLDRLEEAKAALAAHDLLVPGYTMTDLRKGVPYVDGPQTDRYFAGLRKAGLPE